MKIIFWLIPLISIILQLLFTTYSQSQIRYDELAESVRNVFWLHNGFLYDGTSSNVGFYAPLLIIYNLFGFDVNTAKYFRFLLHVFSVFCLAAVFYKWLGSKRGLLPLLVITLSPTLLYMNTLQSSVGIDLQYFPIVLALIYFLDPHKKVVVVIMQFLAWSISMIAWMSYPAFIFYLPVLGILNFSKIKGSNLLSGIIASVAGFVWPFLMALIYLKEKSTLLYDPVSQSGIFRAAGSFNISPDVFISSLGGIFSDLFLRPDSYQVEFSKGEFSDLYPILIILTVIVISFQIIKKKWSKIPIWSLILMAIAIILPSLTFDPSGNPGIRRATAALAFFYILFAVCWHFVNSFKSHFLIKGMLILLLVHHIIVLPINLLHTKDPINDRYPLWFVSKDTPQKSLDDLVERVQKEDLNLVCTDSSGTPFYCRLSEVYAAVKGSCIWNNLDCHQILGWDHLTGNFIPLSTKLWDEYYFEH